MEDEYKLDLIDYINLVNKHIHNMSDNNFADLQKFETKYNQDVKYLVEKGKIKWVDYRLSWEIKEESR